MTIPPSLHEIGTRYQCDKFTRHKFGPIYEAFLAHRRDDPLKLLEIGIGGEDFDLGGSSLKTWEEYFPKASIIGIDIFDKKQLDTRRITTAICDQSDAAALTSIADAHGPFDVVVDDGSHKGSDTLSALFVLFHRLSPGGLYIIEDIQTSYWPQYGGSSIAPACCDTAVRWIKLCVDIINRADILDPGYFPLQAGFAIKSLHVYHNICVIEKDEQGDRTESVVLTDEMRASFLAIDKAMHGDIGAIHQELVSAPTKMKRALEIITELTSLLRN